MKKKQKTQKTIEKKLIESDSQKNPHYEKKSACKHDHS